MEQNNQQVSQKPNLPIKTKIAAWWMIIAGIILILLGLSPETNSSGRVFTFVVGMFFLILPAIDVLKRKSRGFAIVMLLIMIAVVSFNQTQNQVVIIISYLIPSIPFILLISSLEKGWLVNSYKESVIIWKNQLPKKTKIAILWLFLIFVFLILYGLYGVYDIFFGEHDSEIALLLLFALFFLIILIIISIFSFILTFFLSKKSKTAWWLITLILFIGIIISLSKFSFFFPISLIFIFAFIFPFILLLLDRKNFWKIAN